jgi:hypothetical protein
MKRISNIESHKVIICVGSIALFIILLYELCLTSYPSSSDAVFKIGVIFSKILYSIIAASIFYLISQYFLIHIPRQQKKIKILRYVYTKTNYLNYIIEDLQMKLGFNSLNKNVVEFKGLNELLYKINPDNPISEYKNWYQYLYHFKLKILEIIGSINVYNEYLSIEFHEEILSIEKILITPLDIYSGYKKYNLDNLLHLQKDFQDLIIHNKHLQEIKSKEWDNTKKNS